MAFVNLNNATFRKDEVAVAMTHGTLGGGHLGIAFHHAKLGPQVVHLAWHRKLVVEAIPIDKCWIAATVPLTPALAKQVVGMVRAVAHRLPTINYGINLVAAKGSFAVNGSYKAPKGSDGLTCASFVCEVFSAAKVPLIIMPTWKEDEKNKVWASAVLQKLIEDKDKGKVSQDHIDAVAANVKNGLRVRPAEVVAAALMQPPNRPATYEAASVASTEVEVALRDECPLNSTTTAIGAAINQIQ